MSVRLLPALTMAAAATVLLAACGAGGDGSGGTAATATGGASSTAAPTPTKDAALAALVPAAVASDGTIKIATDATYPPNEFTDTDGKTIIGLDVDLGDAIAAKLGLKASFESSAFSGIIPGIQSGQYEMGMSSFTINEDRLKVVDMVSYFSAGTSLAVAQGNPDKITPDNLCGKAVGVQTGTTQADDVTARSKKCTDSGQPAVQVTQLQAQTDVNLALTAGRIVAMLADSPVVAYAAKTTSGAIEVVGDPYDTAPYGIVVNKGQGDYAKAVQGAVQALIADGTYKSILTKWGVDSGAIPTSEVDKVTS